MPDPSGRRREARSKSDRVQQHGHHQRGADLEKWTEAVGIISHLQGLSGKRLGTLQTTGTEHQFDNTPGRPNETRLVFGPGILTTEASHSVVSKRLAATRRSPIPAIRAAPSKSPCATYHSVASLRFGISATTRRRTRAASGPQAAPKPLRPN